MAFFALKIMSFIQLITVDYFSITAHDVEFYCSCSTDIWNVLLIQEWCHTFFVCLFLNQFIVACNVLECPWNQSVPVITFIIAATINSHSFATPTPKMSWAVLPRNQKMESHLSWRLNLLTVSRCWHWRLLTEFNDDIACFSINGSPKWLVSYNTSLSWLVLGPVFTCFDILLSKGLADKQTDPTDAWEFLAWDIKMCP